VDVNLVASLIVRNERHRYLEPCIRHLQEFCDEIRVLDDASSDWTLEWLEGQDKVAVMPSIASGFYAHEGRTRQRLLDWTLQAHPTHVLAVDADEFVTDGQQLRAAADDGSPVGVWSLAMEEVWNADENGLSVRVDGGWRPHQCPILYAVGPRRLRILDRQLACGREPISVRANARRASDTGVSVLHFGWVNREQRQARYQRYVEADGGKFHASTHLRSIMFPDKRIRFQQRGWPTGLSQWQAMILEGAGYGSSRVA